MKKLILSFGVGVVFLAYSNYLRNQHSEPVITPAIVSQTKKSSTSTPSQTTTPAATPSSQYKDGTYTGDSENAFYGNVQVSATIENDTITAVDFLQSPNENPNSQYINSQATPYLKQEALQAQSSNVNIVTGATLTSNAFIESLASALAQAKQS